MDKVKIKLIDGAEIPTYATKGSAGFDLKVTSFKKLFKGNKEVDLKATLQESIDNGYIKLRSFERVLVGTGLFMEFGDEYQLEIRDRSGNALKTGLLVANSPGTVDSDYRGEIGIILVNNTPFLNEIKIGDKVAQGVFTFAVQNEFVQVDELSDTDRGEGGFGSTNKE